MDDGSSDGTSEMVRRNFPSVRLYRWEKSLGYIVQRNQAAALATGTIIFSIDDDATFSSPTVIEATLQDIDEPGIGAVAIPYIEPNKSGILQQIAPDKSGVWVTASYIGTAHAIRRDLFLKLGGYREQLFHQGEESDLCLRMLDAGSFVRLGRSDPIHHWESQRRDFRRMDYYGPRNAILFHWQHTPMRLLVPAILSTTLKCLTLTSKANRLWSRISGLCNGYRSIPRMRRLPARLPIYHLWRRLIKGGPLLLPTGSSREQTHGLCVTDPASRTRPFQ